MAEQDYSRWAAFGGGPPVKKKVEEAAPIGLNPMFQGGPNGGMQMNNSMDAAPMQGAQQEKSFAPAMSSALMRQASNRYDGGMQNFQAPAPQYDEGPPMESSYQNMRGAPQRQEPSQGFWNDLGRSQTQMAGYQPDRGIGKNWGQPMQRQPEQPRQAQYREQPRQEMQGYRNQSLQSQGFHRSAPRRQAPQYGRGNQLAVGRADRPAYGGMAPPSGWQDRLAAQPVASQGSGNSPTLGSAEARASRNPGFNSFGANDRGNW